MTFSYRGISIYYNVMGEGSPLLLVHGWGGSSESLHHLATLLSTNHRAIAVDLPGFGHSQTPPPEWGTAEYAGVLVGLLDKLDIKKIDFFGHSFGGSLGVYLAANTNKISKLILCNSSYKRTNRRSRMALLKSLIPQNKQLKILLYKLFFPDSDLSKYPHLEENFRTIVQTDLSPELHKIRVPTLIVWGEDDTVTPVTLAYELHENIKDSKLEIILNAKHGLPLRNPELLVEPIENFL